MSENLNPQTPTVNLPPTTKLNFWKIGFFIELLLILLLTTAIYFKNNLVKNNISKEENKQTVVIQDDYSFELVIPSGYSLKNKREGDYVAYILDSKEEKIIGFSISSPGGELTPKGEITIDDVPFKIDYRSTIGCPAYIYPSKQPFTAEGLYFQIRTWCPDKEKSDNIIYDQIIKSLKFSQNLKNLLLGKTESSAMFLYTDPNNIFSVMFPYSWFKEKETETNPPPAPTQPLRANCEKTSIQECLNDIILVKIIDNPQNSSLTEIAYQESQQDMGGNQADIILDNKLNALLVDNISAVNLIRKIYFKHDNQIIEVTLLNVGDEDVEQFKSTFKLVSN
ncbi:MAG TPA: hypothetical protein VMW29_04175 [Candidatus Bathyarchaeia archaeon]|nr:hypothetical protein [Candidatus Bathyarchaeia archaeon]